MSEDNSGTDPATEANGVLDTPSDTGTLTATAAASSEADPSSNREPAPLIESRFLYVDVAAQRTKQLRRGALPRLQELAPDPETGARPVPQNKLERIAMREVDGGKIYYQVPDDKKKPKQEKS